tara:strand:+ start:318 stop:677 length:360 start_codon:yes stop_codon:yes gene_type:complete
MPEKKTKENFKPHMMYGDGKSKKTNTYKEHLALKKKGWGHSKPKIEKGGLMNGPSHDNGGIDIEVEGGEIIINKNMNNAAGKHEKNLLNLNNNPDDYIIVKKDNNDYNWPSKDARKRGD